MGTGKTILAIAIINYRKPKSTLVICPPAITKQWREELDKYSSVDNIDIVSNAVLHNVTKNYDMIVFDESHHIKDYKSKRSQHCQRLKLESTYRLILTGTPGDGKGFHYWSQYFFLDMRVFGSLEMFTNNFLMVDIFGGEKGIKHLELLKKKMYEIGSRSINTHLPKVRVKKVMIKEHNEITTFKNEMRTYYEIGDTTIYSNAGLNIYDQRAELGHYTQKSNKFRYMRKLELEEPTIIVYWYQQDLTNLLKLFPEAYQFNSHLKEKEQFIKNGGVLLAQLASMAEGVDGLQHNCSNMIFYSYCFSYQKVAQIMKRIHRPGQTKECTYTFLITRGGVEEHIYNAIKNKETTENFILN